MTFKCLICGGGKREIYYRKKRLPGEKLTPAESLCTGEVGARGKYATIWKCLGCGLIFQDPSFTSTELAAAYGGGEDERYFEQIEQRRELFGKCLKQIMLYKAPPGRLLDVGAGAGLFVKVAKDAGWKAVGIEPSFWAARVAKKRFGVKVKNGIFESLPLTGPTYDVLTMWDVLEHFLDPLAALKKASKLLKKDGVIAIATINIQSWFAKLLGPHWPWLIRVHLWYFTPATLEKLLNKAGFESVSVGSQVRWFSTPYLLTRLTGYNFSWLPKIILPAPTDDIIFVIARKI